jgi:hypothetical protein
MKPISFRRLAVGAVLGLFVSVRAMTWLALADREAAARAAGEQRSIVTVSALADLVSTTRAVGGDVQEAVARFAAGHDDVLWARVVELRNRRLLASTVDDDLAAGPLPRLMERRDRDHQAWYSRAIDLRSAFQANRNAGRALREEIVVERLDDGQLSLAAPMEYGGHVLGAVVINARGGPVDLGGGSLPWLAATAGLALFLVAGWPLRKKGRRLAVVAGAVLAVALGAVIFATLEDLSAGRRAAEEAVASRLASELERTNAFGKIAESLRPRLWDVDRFRKPREVVSPNGSVDAPRFRSQFLLIGLLGLGLAAIVGLSGRGHSEPTARDRAAL